MARGGGVVDSDPNPAWQDPGTGAWGPGEGWETLLELGWGGSLGPIPEPVFAGRVHLPSIFPLRGGEVPCLWGQKGAGPFICVSVDILVVTGLAGACR